MAMLKKPWMAFSTDYLYRFFRDISVSGVSAYAGTRKPKTII
jgi:hypothetical protein